MPKTLNVFVAATAAGLAALSVLVAYLIWRERGILTQSETVGYIALPVVLVLVAISAARHARK